MLVKLFLLLAQSEILFGLFLLLHSLELFLFFFSTGWKTVQEILEVIVNFKWFDVFRNVAHQVLDFILNTSEFTSLFIFISSGLI